MYGLNIIREGIQFRSRSSYSLNSYFLDKAYSTSRNM